MKNKDNSRLFWAVLLCAGGLLLLMRNFGYLNFKTPLYLLSWKLIPLIVGVNAFLKGKKFEGVIGISIAAILFVPEFLTKEQAQTYYNLWPLLLVGLGGIILSKFFYPDLDKPSIARNKKDEKGFDYVSETAFWAGTNSKVLSKNFSGGRINTIMGGVEIDLRESELADNAVIDIFCVMGGIEIVAPKEWNIKLDILPIMGGADDEISKHSADVIDNSKRLILSGTVIMGGVGIKRV